MLTALDAPESALDDGEADVVEKIREHGWFGHHILAEADLPEFSFTTGFWLTLGHPEIIVFGLKSKIAHDVLWSIFRDIKAGNPPVTGARTPDFFGNNVQACLFPMDKAQYAEHLGWSCWFYAGDDFPCLQLVWPDRAGIFPWESAFDPDMAGLQIDVTQRGWTEPSPAV